jgi:hypothetical protein
MNRVLLIWPLVPAISSIACLFLYPILDPTFNPPAWALLPERLAAPWLLVGMLLGAGVLYWRPPDRLGRHDVAAPAVSIGCNAAWLSLCWHLGARLPWPFTF